MHARQHSTHLPPPPATHTHTHRATYGSAVLDGSAVVLPPPTEEWLAATRAYVQRRFVPVLEVGGRAGGCAGGRVGGWVGRKAGGWEGE